MRECRGGNGRSLLCSAVNPPNSSAGSRIRTEAGTILRRTFETARSRLFSAVFLIALGAPPSGTIVLAQAENAAPATPELQSSTASPKPVFDATGRPVLRMMASTSDRVPDPYEAWRARVMAPTPDRVPDPYEASRVPGASMMVPAPAPAPAPRNSNASPDAIMPVPGVPGVVMMAPFPDKPPAAQTPAAAPGAPSMPGVIMMSPIPDKPPMPVARPAIASTLANAADRAFLSQAFAAASRDWNRARLLAAQAGDPVGRLIIEWRYVLDETSGANFETIDAFRNEHPNWPRRDAQTIRAEKAMPDDMEPSEVIRWYGNRAPLSGTGTIRLGAALMAVGRRQEGAELIRKGWVEYTFSPYDENQICSTYESILGPAEQKARLDQLLAREDSGGATRQLRRVDAETQRLANARLKIKASPSVATVKSVLASLPQSALSDTELMFDAARALRRREQDEDAWALMAKAPSNKDILVLPERWSVERSIMARDALRAGKLELAYQFASTPALDSASGTTFMDAEFLAGWIALQFLHKPELALNHFDRLAKGVVNPISVARAHYWLGRTAEAMKRTEDAAVEYGIAAQHGATFYGQLALAKISAKPVLRLNAAASDPSFSDRAAFEADERVKAIRLLADFGDRGTIRLFALSIVDDQADARRLQLLAQLMGSVGDPAMSVRVAKNASYGGINLVSYLHPVLAIPNFGQNAPEPALVLGLTRQESEFDPTAVSSAGARGLMQLMPASAKHAATMRGMAYRQNDLSNPAYNMQLGMATIAEYLDRWSGSYVLAIASYNAGPSNVRNWVEIYGDPRDPGVDPIDWIESIPFPETRNYVQRVMENLEVYRNRVSNSDQQLAILSDLYRPSPVNFASAKPLPAIGSDTVTATPAATGVLAPVPGGPR